MAKVEPMTHDALVAWCVDYLNLLPCSYAYETHGGWRNKPKTPGIADVANVRDGKAYYYEIKVGKDFVSHEQHDFAMKVRYTGRGEWHVIKTPEDLLVCLKEEQIDARR